MSRHEIEAFDPLNKVIVGWDPPLQTFFVQVIVRKAEEAGDDDEKLVLWEGCSMREIQDVDDLGDILRHHAELTPEIRLTLDENRNEDQ
ncbi:hypothetical protein [Bradyrhizobium roseum]|uniref:hypothetical protein n=1 Tax=Bradyrhizobium roseum TaxID=3056648 RepID=UPI00261A44A8|nr:hypothetical protein [Bradyrhizobium roseus]WKA31625.1 hypothetical protein QUH67_16325 [Bradyrhizobium roseus]